MGGIGRTAIIGGAVAAGYGLWRAKIARERRLDDLGGAVPQTSRNIASWRALEQESPDKLFHDPLAAIFAGPAALRRARGMSAPPPLYLRAWRRITGHPFSEEELLRGSLLRNRFAIRTAWFDAAVIEAVTPPRGATQVVLLGAGMDSRAWRLTFPQDVHWFEVDYPSVLNAKASLLRSANADLGPLRAPPGVTRLPLGAQSYHQCAADIAEESWMQSLIKAGWSPAKPTVWLGEGLLMYLEPTAVARLLRALRNVSPPGSTLLMSLVSQGAVARARQSRSNGAMSQWQWGTDDPRGYFGMLNWRVELVETPEECGPRYGRRMPLRRARAQSLGRQGSARAEVDPGVQTAVPLSPARQEQGALRATFYVRATC